MAIGERIHFFRTLRGMTQKYLGMALGFPEKSADVRLAQYENGSRTPKADVTAALAKVLDVSPKALDVPDIDSYTGLMHTLFTLVINSKGEFLGGVIAPGINTQMKCLKNATSKLPKIDSQCTRFMEQNEMRRRKQVIADMAKEYKADGIIIASNKFCEYWSYERVIDTVVLQRDFGYPVCSIEKEYINSASGQLRTRFQAFIESVEIKKIQGGNN